MGMRGPCLPVERPAVWQSRGGMQVNWW